MAKYKITVNRDACTGCGACVGTCQESFEMVEGKSKPKKEKVKELGCIEEAAENCPVKCIKIEEIKG